MPKRGLTLPVLHFQDGGVTPDPAAIAAAQQIAGQFRATGGAPPAQAAPQFSLPSEQGMPVGTGALTGIIPTLRQPPAPRATLVAPPAPGGPAIPGRQQPYGLGEEGMPIGTGALLGTGLMSGQPPLAKGALAQGTSGLATTFADPGDIARYKAARAAGKSEEEALMVGDNGVGNPALGGIDTTKSYGIAMPENWLRRQYGNDKSAWRRARALLTVNGQTIQVPYVDTGPGQGPQSKGIVTDLSYNLAKALGSTGLVKATVQPGGKGGADYLDDPDSWQEEQDQIVSQLNPQGQLAGIGMQHGGPVPTKEQIDAAKQQADQYAARTTPPTPDVGLLSVPATPPTVTPVEQKPPAMAPGLGTVGGAPQVEKPVLPTTPPPQPQRPLTPEEASAQTDPMSGAVIGRGTLEAPKPFAPEPSDIKSEAKPKTFVPEASDIKPEAKPKVFTPDASDIKAPAAPPPE